MDLDAAFKKDLEGFWVIRFIGNDTPLVMDAKLAAERQMFILEKYQVSINNQ